MKDYADSKSPVWNNLAYDDTSSQQKAMKEAHDRMVTEGKVVEVPESTMQKTAESFPDLRDMKQTADGRSDSQIYNWGIKKSTDLGRWKPGAKLPVFRCLISRWY